MLYQMHNTKLTEVDAGKHRAVLAASMQPWSACYEAMAYGRRQAACTMECIEQRSIATAVDCKHTSITGAHTRAPARPRS